MTIREYINALEKIASEHGDDFEVLQNDCNSTLGSVTPARAPRVEEMAKLQGKEKNARYVLCFEDKDANRKTGRYFVYVGR